MYSLIGHQVCCVQHGMVVEALIIAIYLHRKTTSIYLCDLPGPRPSRPAGAGPAEPSAVSIKLNQLLPCVAEPCYEPANSHRSAAYSQHLSSIFCRGRRSDEKRSPCRLAWACAAPSKRSFASLAVSWKKRLSFTTVGTNLWNYTHSVIRSTRETS
jgi:hypothetical protein